jgi:replicative DNA helicase
MAKRQVHPPPPWSKEAEQALLGSILVRPEVLERVAAKIEPTDFYQEAHGRIFQAMPDLSGRGAPVDLVTGTALLKEQDQLDRVGGPDIKGELFLAALRKQVGFATNADYYARIVAEKADLRRKRELALNIIEACDSSGNGLDGLISQISAPRRGPASFNPITAKELGNKEFPPLTAPPWDAKVTSKGKGSGAPVKCLNRP